MFVVILLAMVLQLIATYDSALSIAANARDHIGMLAIVLLCLAGAVSLAFRRTEIRITAEGIERRSRIGPFSRTRTYALRDTDVRVEVFSFDPWDPHVALHCGETTLRVGWGLPEERLQEIASGMREQVERARTARGAC